MNVVEFERVSKTYRIYDKPGDRLKEALLPNGRTLHRSFRALDEVSFSVRRGEVFCIIGENGSGKSTALQIMAGILQPTSGEARVHGRAAALLELGAGFNPEFSGRENVYLNASILGLAKREIDQRYDAILDFAEIGSFVDRPVKTYSSGMVLRLAFAVAIHVDPEVLIVDEALAVGDAYFRHRCMRKVQELRSQGLTILFVSHSMAEVKAIGDRALWLRNGQAAALGSVGSVVDKYLANVAGAGRRAVAAMPDSIPNIDRRHGSGDAEILGFSVLNEFEEPLQLITPNSAITIRISLRARRKLDSPDAGFLMRNHLGLEFSGTAAAREGQPLPPLEQGDAIRITFQLEIPELYPSSFSFSPWIRNGETVCDWIDNALTVQMARGDRPIYGYVQWPCRVQMSGASVSQEETPVG